MSPDNSQIRAHRKLVSGHLLNTGLKVSPVPGDGSCLFHSVIASALDLLGWHLPAVSVLRSEVADELLANGGRWMGFGMDTNTQDFRDEVAAYAADIRGGGWGDTISLNILSSLYSLDIHVVQPAGWLPECDANCHTPGVESTPLGHIWICFFPTEQHYDAVQIDHRNRGKIPKVANLPTGAQPIPFFSEQTQNTTETQNDMDDLAREIHDTSLWDSKSQEVTGDICEETHVSGLPDCNLREWDQVVRNSCDRNNPNPERETQRNEQPTNAQRHSKSS